MITFKIIAVTLALAAAVPATSLAADPSLDKQEKQPAAVKPEDQKAADQKVLAEGSAKVKADIKAQKGESIILNELIVAAEKQKEKVPPKLLEQAKQDLKVRAKLLEFAEQRIKDVETAPNSADAQANLYTALKQVEQAKYLSGILPQEVGPTQIKEAPSGLPPIEGGPVALPSSQGVPVAPPQPPGGPKFGMNQVKPSEFFMGGAMRQLIAIAGKDPQKKRSFTEEMDPQTAEALGYDKVKKVLVDRSGFPVNVAPLVNAVVAVAPEISPENIFMPMESPGVRPIAPLNPHVKKIMASPAKLQEMKKVGGVALAVTLDLLSYLGIPEFRHLGPATVVESPVLLSLAKLQTELAPYAQSPPAWETLPEKLRYPGSLARIHGFILDPKNQDIFLVGSTGPLEQAIEVDSLILGLRSVWMEGRIPSVSLDPLPDRSAGPQYSKVYEIPFHSTFAKIMLDADYAMKRILFGHLDVNLPAFKELNRSYLRHKFATSADTKRANRFWLTPIPLGRGNIHISPTYRTVLFDSGVRCLTEILNAPRPIAGRIDEVAEEEAKLFTSSYPGLEKSTSVVPPAIFARLHGLVDVVTVGNLLRAMKIPYPILQEFCRLPVRILRGEESVPAFYPGLEVKIGEIKTQDVIITRSLIGGAVLQPRLGRHSLDIYHDVTTATLEKKVDSWPVQPAVVRVEGLTFTLPQAREEGSRGNRRLDQKFLDGQAALAVQNYPLAGSRFLEITTEDPLRPEAWASLGVAQSMQGQHPKAIAAIGKARELDPDDPVLMEKELNIFLRAGRNFEVSQLDKAELRNLSLRISVQANGLTDRDRKTQARELADVALKLWGQNPDAYFVRSQSWDNDLGVEAIRDRQQALRYYRSLLDNEGRESWRHPLAFALLSNASASLKGLKEKVPGKSYDQWQHQAQIVEMTLKELDKIIDEIAEARSLDESLGLAWAYESETKAVKVKILKDLGKEGNFQEARDIAFQAIEKFPDLPDAHFSLAIVGASQVGQLAKTMSNDFLTRFSRREILERLDKAISLDPSYQAAYVIRARFNATLGECAQALADLERAKSLSPPLHPRLEQAIRAMCNEKRAAPSPTPSDSSDSLEKKLAAAALAWAQAHQQWRHAVNSPEAERQKLETLLNQRTAECEDFTNQLRPEFKSSGARGAVVFKYVLGLVRQYEPSREAAVREEIDYLGRQQTKTLINTLNLGVERYLVDHGTFPFSGIANLAKALATGEKPYVQLPPGSLDREGRIVDFWGRPLTYEVIESISTPGLKVSYRLNSRGPIWTDEGDQGEKPDK